MRVMYYNNGRAKAFDDLYTGQSKVDHRTEFAQEWNQT